jgi:hypothetical protein
MRLSISIARFLYEFFVLFFCLSIIISYANHNSLIATVRLYSYLSIYFTILAFIFCVVVSCTNLYLILTKEQGQVPHNLLVTLRNNILIFVLIQQINTTIYFWANRFDPQAMSYGTFCSHTIVLPLVVVECIFLKIEISHWTLLFSIYYVIFYYFCSIYVYVTTDVWIYDSLNPDKQSIWFIILVCIPYLEFVFYSLIFWINEKKNFYFYGECDSLAETSVPLKRFLYIVFMFMFQFFSNVLITITFSQFTLDLGYVAFFISVECFAMLLNVFFLITQLTMFDRKKFQRHLFLLSMLSEMALFSVTLYLMIMLIKEKIAWVFFMKGIQCLFSIVLCILKNMTYKD